MISMTDSENTDPAGRPGPVTSGERIESLDLLRGVAVLGILVMNIYAFAMPFAAYVNPYQMGGDEPWNLGTWVFTHLFFDQKFMSIFSMLFGAGIVLMMERAEARGSRFGPVFFRRQLWLLVLGLLHATLIWFGDILAYYAVVAMIVYFLRRFSPRRLVLVACLMLPLPLLINYGMSFFIEGLEAQATEIEQRLADGGDVSEEEQASLKEWLDMRSFVAPTPEDVQDDVDVYQGHYSGMVAHRLEKNLPMFFSAIPFFVLWRAGGLMVLGMALIKLGVLSGNRSSAFYRRLALIGYGVGLPLSAASAWQFFASGFDPIIALRSGNAANYVGSVLVALGHVAAIMLLAKSGAMSRLAARFKAVGRMALTNYLMHSVVMTTLFYGYGFGLYGQVPRLWQMLFVAGLIALQLALSPWWLDKYRFGPVEWAWRSLTYGRRQPFRV